mgnify:CR=1 FL=1
MQSIITFEERWALEGKQRRERPYSTLPMYRFISICPACNQDHEGGHMPQRAECKSALPTERIIRSYPRG